MLINFLIECLSWQVRIDGEGPACPIIAVADGEGRVRGTIKGPLTEAPPKPNGKLDVGAVVGAGGPPKG